MTPTLEAIACVNPCGHPATDHEGGSCSGPTISGNPCRCSRTPDAIRDLRLEQFREALLCAELEPSSSLVETLQLDRQGHYYTDGHAMREILLASNEGQQLWQDHVDDEGFRDDAIGTKTACLALSFPTLSTAVDSGQIRFVDTECALSPTEGLRAGRVLLRGERWLKGWSARELERWACSADACESGAHAARFVLGVWDRRYGDGEWACGPFRFHHAYRKWDDEHRAAFMQWLAEPWWA